MADDLKIPVSAPGAKQTEQQLRGVADAEQKIGRAGEATGKQVTRGSRSAATSIRDLWRAVKSLFGAYMGLAAAQRVLASLRRETERIDQATRQAAESMRAVLALSSLKGERAEVQKKVQQMAVQAGLPIEQVAPAYYTLLGGTAGMDMQRRNALMQQALLMAKTDPRASLESLVNLFSTIGTQQPGLSPQQIGNLVSRTIEQAKATPEEMAQYVPSILTTAQAAKVDPATAMAMFSFGTRMGGGVAQSGTAVRAAMLGLLAPAPETLKQLKQYGYQPQAELLDKISWLAASGGQLPPELVAALGGRRGLEAIASISGQPEVFRREVDLMRGAASAQGSLLSRRLAEMYGEMPAQRMLDQIKQIEVIRQREATRPETMWEKQVIDYVLASMERRRRSPIFRDMAEAGMKTSRYLGMSVIPPDASAPERALLELLQEGYMPADLMEFAEPVAERREKLPMKHGLREVVEHEKRILREALDAAGVRTMQSPGVNYQGGTHHHYDERRDPAGRPLPARGR